MTQSERIRQACAKLSDHEDRKPFSLSTLDVVKIVRAEIRKSKKKVK